MIRVEQKMVGSKCVFLLLPKMKVVGWKEIHKESATTDTPKLFSTVLSMYILILTSRK